MLAMRMSNSDPLRDGYIYLIPEMNFTCNGTIMSVEVFGSKKKSTHSYPVLQIWREKEHGRGMYYKVGNSDIILNPSRCIKQMTARAGHSIFVCNLSMDQYVSVKSGDILGLRLPPSSMSGFEIFTRRSFPTLNSYVYVGPNHDPQCVNLSDISYMRVQQPQIKLQGTYIHVEYILI